MSIRQLPEDVIYKLKSSVVITSLNGVVCELLKNALDAGSTKVNIYVDYGRGGCTLEDNGQGIPPSEFREDGGLGKLHHTSKHPPASTIHGSHGNFLASVANLSLISIISHHRKHNSHNAITIHNGRVLVRHCPSPPEQTLHTFQHGTRVAVRDLFGSMPVRVKHRAAASSQKSHLEKEWRRLLLGVVAILLSWPSDVTVMLQDSAQQREARLRSQEKTNIATRTSRLLTQSGFAESSSLDAWIPVSAASRPIKIKGCIYQHPVATRHCQFISLGVHPVLDDYGTNVLYEEVNKMFTNSAFALNDDVESDHTGGRKEIRSSQSQAKRRTERWPMFYLEIQQPGSGVSQSIDDILYDRRSNLSDIVDLLRAVCYGFLRKHQLQPRKAQMSSDSSVFSTRGKLGQSVRGIKRSQSLPSDDRVDRIASQDQKLGLPHSPFGDWHRIKSGQVTNRRPGNFDKPSINKKAYGTSEPLVGPGGMLLRKPFLDVGLEAPALVDAAGDHGHEPRPKGDNEGLGKTSALDQSSQPRSRHRPLERRTKPPPSDWLQGIIRSWQNPVFETVECPVPQAYDEFPKPMQAVDGQTQAAWSSSAGGCGTLFGSASLALQGRVSRNALANAEVISQVDRKFILLKLPLDDSTDKSMQEGQDVLVMVDQHAADERCRLEELMAEYFIDDSISGLEVVVEALNRSQIYEVSVKEGALLRQYKPLFESWGILYRLQDNSDETTTVCRVEVTGLPPSILERCRSEPRLLIELLRKEIWRLSDEGHHPESLTVTARSDKSRTSHFRKCPRALLELLHSRSCRSAIMFNDVLSRKDCEGLVARLAGCDFPFQCAHGRPSMAPLVGLGSGSRMGGWDEGSGEVNAVSWKKFMEDGTSTRTERYEAVVI